MPSTFSQLPTIWQRLGFNQRATIIIASIVTVGLISALIFYGSQPDYSILFTDLKPSNAQLIVEKLKASNIQYKISDGGSTISVPSEKVTELRLQVAAAGTLAGEHVGFDIFDKNSFGVTDFTQQVNYQRALEGELARTLESMDEVETARVHITRSKESLFTEKAEPAKASILLALKKRELSRDRIDAIVNLVASAVEGLSPENVSLLDTKGRLLVGALNNSDIKGAHGVDSFLDVRRKFETETASRLVSLLESITGSGHVSANVSAEMDFSQIEQTEEKYDPKSSVIRTEQKSQETKGSANGVGGIAGTRANDPTAPAPAVQSATGPNNLERLASNIAYDIDKTTKRITGRGGRVSRLSVSVLVDENVEGTNKDQTAKRSPEELTKIQELVTAAVGIDTNRGDQITVRMIPFFKAGAEVVNISWLERNRELVRTAVKYGILALVTIVLIFFVIRPANKVLYQAALPPKPEEPPLLAPAPVEVLLKAAEEEQQEQERLQQSISESGTVNSIEASMESNSLGPKTEREIIEREIIEREIIERERKKQAKIEEEEEERLLEFQKNPTNAMKMKITEKLREQPDSIAVTIRTWLQDSGD